MFDIAIFGTETAHPVGWSTYAELALFLAVAEAVGPKGRRRMFRRLEAMAIACERAAKVHRLGRGPLSADGRAEAEAAERFIRPALSMLRSQYPDG